MSVTTIVLAASPTPRSEGPEALESIDGSSFLGRIAQLARDAGSVSTLVVIGPHEGDRVKTKLPPGAATVWNPDPSRGPMSSIQAALGMLPSRTMSVLLWPVGLVKVELATVRRLMEPASGRILVPRYRDQIGHPVRVPQRFFGALSMLPSDATIESFIGENAGSVTYVDVDDPGVRRDAPAAPEKAVELDRPARRGKST